MPINPHDSEALKPKKRPGTEMQIEHRLETLENRFNNHDQHIQAQFDPQSIQDEIQVLQNDIRDIKQKIKDERELTWSNVVEAFIASTKQSSYGTVGFRLRTHIDTVKSLETDIAKIEELLRTSSSDAVQKQVLQEMVNQRVQKRTEAYNELFELTYRTMVTEIVDRLIPKKAA